MFLGTKTGVKIKVFDLYFFFWLSLLIPKRTESSVDTLKLLLVQVIDVAENVVIARGDLALDEVYSLLFWSIGTETSLEILDGILSRK